MTEPANLWTRRDGIAEQQAHLRNAGNGNSPAMRRLNNDMVAIENQIGDTLRRAQREKAQGKGFTRT